MHYVSICVNKTCWTRFYCTLGSSTCFGCYVHPSSGAQLFGTRPRTTHYMRTYTVPSRLYTTVLLRMDGRNIRNM